MAQEARVAERAHPRAARRVDVVVRDRLPVRPTRAARAPSARCASSKNGQSRWSRFIGSRWSSCPRTSGVAFAANASYARRKSSRLHADRLRLRLRLDLAVEIHRPRLVQQRLGHARARTSARRRASARTLALPRAASPAATTRLKKPHASASSAGIARPVYSSSAARPCPIMRGNSAHAPMSAPARPTRTNRNAVFARRRAEPQVGREREHRARAGADAVDGRDDRLRAMAHRLDEVAGHAREREQLRSHPCASAAR